MNKFLKRFFYSIHGRLLTITLSLVILMSLILTLLFFALNHFTLKNYIDKKNQLALHKLERLLSVPLLKRDYVMIVDIIDEEKKSSDLSFIWVLDKNETVIACNDENQIRMPISDLYLDSENFTSFELSDGGAICILPNYTIINIITEKVLWVVALSSLFILIIFSYFANRLSHRLTDPINKVVEASARIARGEFQIVLQHSSITEIDDLTTSLIDSANKLEQLTKKITQEKERLIISEKKYRRLVENLSDEYFFYAHDVNGRFTYLSPSIQNILGYSIDEFSDQYDKHLTKSPRNEEVKSLTQLALQGIKQAPYELEIYHKDNSVRYLYVVENPVLDNTGNVLAVEGIAHDITDRKKAEEALKISEEKYRATFENSGNALAIIEDDTTISMVNKKFQELSLFSKDEVEGKKKFSEFIADKEDLEKMTHYHQLRRLDPLSVPVSYEFKLIDKSGTIRVASVIVSLLPGTNQSLAALTDITQRKKNEEVLRKLSAAVEQSPVGIMITDTKGLIEYINPRLAEITGYTGPEIIGKNFQTLKSDSTTPIIFDNLWETITRGDEWRGEFYSRRKNGESYWEVVSIIPISDPAGEMTHFLSVYLDITEKKKFEKELIASKEKAEKSDRLKSEFLAQISHEIRTPINTIFNFTELLKEELDFHKKPDQMEYFNVIAKSGDRIIRTIDMILNMSEIQTGSYECVYKEIVIYPAILQKIYSEFVHKAQKKNIKLKLNSLEKESRVIGDSYSVEQILMNIIDNALKYTYEGVVEITPKINEEGILAISVADTGIGIAKEYLPEIFNAFSQEEQGYTRKYEGSGLGLALVKKYCDFNNIQISVESVKNKGTTFTMTFENQDELKEKIQSQSLINHSLNRG